MIQAFYFFYFQAMAINMAYMPAHLRALGLSGRQTAIALSVSPMLALVVPLGWAWLADRTRRHDRVLRLVAGGAFVGLTPLVVARGAAAHSFAVVLAGYFGYAVFAVGAGGLADALAVARVRTGAIYGRMRMWGSLGYVVTALVTGAALGFLHLDLGGPAAPLAIWIGLGGAFAVSWRLGGTGEAAARPHATDVGALLASPGLRAILIAGALHWACMAPYNVFLGVYLHDLGVPPPAWGMAYSIGVVAEMLVLLHFHRLQARFKIDTLLGAAFLASAFRWLAVARVRSPVALVLLQSLHGMTFGMFWSAAIAEVAVSVPASVRATGQALLVMAINLGGAIGNLGTGALYDALGPRTLFALAAAGELLPLAVVWRARRHLGARAAPVAAAPSLS